jgi:hypothetical protein
MMPINTFFWMLIVFFCIMGALRGWDKETLVSFSVVVALFLRLVFSTYVPFVREFLNGRPPVSQFYIYGGLVLFMAFVGYAGPVLSTRLASKVAQRKAQDILLGGVLGAFNGYMIVGTIWHFLHAANYGLFGIQAPAVGSPAEIMAVTYLPPVWLTPAPLLITVALSFVFVLIVQL